MGSEGANCCATMVVRNISEQKGPKGIAGLEVPIKDIWKQNKIIKLNQIKLSPMKLNIVNHFKDKIIF
jgi:hypothetical protein